MEEEINSLEYQRLLKIQDWESILSELLIYAGIYYKHLSVDEREELVHRAIESVFMRNQAWCQKKRPKLLDHLKWVMKSIAGNQSQLSEQRKRAHSVKNPDGVLINPIENVSQEASSPEEEFDNKMRIERLQASIKDDEEMDVFIALEGGAQKPSEVAGVTGLSVQKVYNILTRFRRREAKLED